MPGSIAGTRRALVRVQARAEPGRPPRPRHLLGALLRHGGEFHEVKEPVGVQVAPAGFAQFPFREYALVVNGQREPLDGRERGRPRLQDRARAVRQR
jgi:hypothetical protein